MIASKVKARPESENLQELKASSKAVADSTAQVIATCRALSNQVRIFHFFMQTNSLIFVSLQCLHLFKNAYPSSSTYLHRKFSHLIQLINTKCFFEELNFGIVIDYYRLYFDEVSLLWKGQV